MHAAAFLDLPHHTEFYSMGKRIQAAQAALSVTPGKAAK
jgi:hypothetical protein